TRQLDVVKTGDGVGFRPDPDAATLVAVVSHVHNLCSVQEGNERTAAHIDAQLVPDAVHHLRSGAFQLAAPSTYSSPMASSFPIRRSASAASPARSSARRSTNSRASRICRTSECST